MAIAPPHLTEYAEVDLLTSDEWPRDPTSLAIEHQMSVLARAILILAEGGAPRADLKRVARALATGEPA